MTSSTADIVPSSYWPTSGGIIFDSVSVSYGDDLPLALNNVSFVVKPHEKIGVVGKSGAGRRTVIYPILILVLKTPSRFFP